MPGLTNRQTRRKPLGGLRKWLLLLAAVAALYLSRAIWLRQMGEFLVRADAPRPAEVAVVLAGDGYGHRILKAIEFYRQGYVKQVIVDGPKGWYGFDEADLAIRFAVDRGAPREIFVPLTMKSRSTLAEARAVDAELRKRNVHKALIVTSNFHTRRSRAIFRREGSKDIQYLVVSAPDEDFAPEDWWRSRDAQKVLFMEYVKLVNWWLVD